MRLKFLFPGLIALGVFPAYARIATRYTVPKDASEVRMYVMVTPSHQEYFDKWFKPTLQDDYQLVVTKFDQGASEGVFMRHGWAQAVLKKVEMIIRAIEENSGQVFVYSDVDIQFFRPTWPLLAAKMHKYDMLMQVGSRFKHKRCCTGFFACVGNDRTLKMWRRTRNRLLSAIKDNREIGDQEVFNSVVNDYPSVLRIGILPTTFMNGGMFVSKRWGMQSCVPKNIVLHHANWVKCTDGQSQISAKLEQLEHVRNQFNTEKEKNIF